MGVGVYTDVVLHKILSKYRTVGIIRILVGKVDCELYEDGRGKVLEYTIRTPVPKNYFFVGLTLPIIAFIQYSAILISAKMLFNKTKAPFSICIGEFYTGSVCGVILRRAGVVKKLVYWAIDWFPYRSIKDVGLLRYFGNSVLHPYLDRFCVMKSDITWNLSQRIIDARKICWNDDEHINHKKQIVISPPYIPKYPDYPDFSQIRDAVGYIGILKEGQGLELAMEATLALRKKNLPITLHIIGTSRNEQYYMNYAKQIGISEKVIFHGFLETNQISEILKTCKCGIALFEGGANNYTYYTWPSKVGIYLSYGLPVIMTKVPSLADELEKEGAGILVNYDVDSVATAIQGLVCNNDDYKKYKNNVIQYVDSRKSGDEIIQSINSLM